MQPSFTNVPINYTDTGYINNFTKACFFANSQEEIDSIFARKKIRVQLPSAREVEEINQILDYIGLPQNFSIYKGDVRNAMSTVIDGKRFVIFSKDLLARVDRTSGTLYWSSMFILAHEIGHHLSNHFSENELSPFDIELQADRFAGSILCRLGANINEALITFDLGFLSGAGNEKSHPPNDLRKAAVKEGWLKTMKQLDYSFAVPPPPANDDFTEEYFAFQFGFDSTSQIVSKDLLELENSKNDTVAFMAEAIITKTIEYVTDSLEYYQDGDIGQIQVEITKDLTLRKDDYSAYEPGARLLLEVPYGDNLCNLCRRGYMGLYARGKKIRFKAVQYGTGLYKYIYHIEFLKRTDEKK